MKNFILKNKLVRELQKAFWIRSNSKEFPHSYTLRKNWIDYRFVEAVKGIRKYGKPERFFYKTYIYFYANSYKYWTMGYPLTNCSKTGTILINRARATYDTMYDKISKKYDLLFTSESKKQEDQQIIDMINPVGKVLDIGCGTGLFLDYTKYKDYLGIDKSNKMLKVLKRKHPNANVINTSLQDFYPSGKFDTIIGLFGVGSYLTEQELKKIDNLISNVGKIFIMHYQPEYYPETYKKTGIECKRYIHKQNGLDEIEFNNYIIYKDV